MLDIPEYFTDSNADYLERKNVFTKLQIFNYSENLKFALLWKAFDLKNLS